MKPQWYTLYGRSLNKPSSSLLISEEEEVLFFSLFVALHAFIFFFVTKSKGNKIILDFWSERLELYTSLSIYLLTLTTKLLTLIYLFLYLFVHDFMTCAQKLFSSQFSHNAHATPRHRLVTREHFRRAHAPLLVIKT